MKTSTSSKPFELAMRAAASPRFGIIFDAALLLAYAVYAAVGTEH